MGIGKYNFNILKNLKLRIIYRSHIRYQHNTININIKLGRRVQINKTFFFLKIELFLRLSIIFTRDCIFGLIYNKSLHCANMNKLHHYKNFDFHKSFHLSFVNNNFGPMTASPGNLISITISKGPEQIDRFTHNSISVIKRILYNTTLYVEPIQTTNQRKHEYSGQNFFLNKVFVIYNTYTSSKHINQIGQLQDQNNMQKNLLDKKQNKISLIK